jgi:hypothetical protein
MTKKNILKIGLWGCCAFILLPMISDASQTSNLPSGWNSESHTSLVSKVHEIKGFIFSTPVMIGAIFAFAMAIYHTFREGSVMPLLTVIGIIILASLAPLILDIVQPASASGMTLDSLKELVNFSILK